MGFTTLFWGRIEVEPALPEATRRRLVEWASQDHRDGSTPGVWCQWVPTPDGSALVWDGEEKFYDADSWMRYIIGQFIADKHTANGLVFAATEPEMGLFSAWSMTVKDNVVLVVDYEVPYLDFDDETEELLEKIDILGALSDYAADPERAFRSIEGDLCVIRDQLGHPQVASALARFIYDMASVLPLADRLRSTTEAFIQR